MAELILREETVQIYLLGGLFFFATRSSLSRPDSVWAETRVMFCGDYRLIVWDCGERFGAATRVTVRSNRR